MYIYICMQVHLLYAETSRIGTLPTICALTLTGVGSRTEAIGF